MNIDNTIVINYDFFTPSPKQSKAFSQSNPGGYRNTMVENGAAQCVQRVRGTIHRTPFRRDVVGTFPAESTSGNDQAEEELGWVGVHNFNRKRTTEGSAAAENLFWAARPTVD